MKLTNEDVQDILQLVNVSSFNVLNLQTDRFKLSLRRTGDGEWTQSAQGRRVKAYTLTPQGRRQLAAEKREWDKVALAMAQVLES